MKLRGENRAQLLRSTDALVQPTEPRVGFDPEVDLKPEIKEYMLRALEADANRDQWMNYLFFLAKAKVLWPDLPVPVQPTAVPMAELNSRMPHYLADPAHELMYAAEIKSLGVSPGALLNKSGVQRLINRTLKEPYVGGSPATFLNLARLGIKPLMDLFPNRDGAWQAALNYLNGFNTNSLREYLPSVGAELRLLFPEHEHEVPITQADIQFTLSVVRATKPIDISGKIDIMIGLYLMTADQLELGSNGEFIVHRKPKLPGFQTRQLPPRNFT